MTTLDEIKQALGKLSLDELALIAHWVDGLSNAPHEKYGVAEAQPAYASPDYPYMTVEEFFEFEKNSKQRYEYVDGYVYAMTGPSLAHVRITGELLFAFKSHLRGTPCEPFATNAKLRIHSDTDDLVYYPDLMVACNRDEWGENFVCNPKLVIEVLSPSTQRIDRMEKATTYRSVPSIEEYALVRQDKYELTIYRRIDKWRPQVYAGAEQAAQFRSIGLSVPLAKLYEGTLPVS